MYADTVLPMKHYQTVHGKCVEFQDIVKFTNFYLLYLDLMYLLHIEVLILLLPWTDLI